MRVLGIDPGTQHLGLGLVERKQGRLLHVRHFLLKPRMLETLPERLAYIHDQISAVIAEHRPDVVAVEGVFHARNARSAIILAHARGVALACAARAGLEVHEYPPSTVKKAVGVSGSAEKDAVSRMVSTLLNIPPVERSDCADALAVAICHLARQPLLIARESLQGPKRAAANGIPPGGWAIVRRS